jgi:hypothetical protein
MSLQRLSLYKDTMPPDLANQWTGWKHDTLQCQSCNVKHSKHASNMRAVGTITNAASKAALSTKHCKRTIICRGGHQ